MRKVALHRIQSRLNQSFRQQSGLSISQWVHDVVRSRSLQPPNPILSNLSSKDDESERLPAFSRMLPYHLEGAVQTAVTQYAVELAELEVSLTGTVETNKDLEKRVDLLQKLDQIEAPIFQILEVGRLFTELASRPDQHEQWQKAHRKAKLLIDEKVQPYTQSKIIYQALIDMANESDSGDFPRNVSMAFEKEGVSLEVEADGGNDELQRVKTISDQLKLLEKQLETISSYQDASKAARLNTVKCMYNVVGLSHLQAQQLNYPTVSSMAMTAHNNLALSQEEVLDLHDKVSEFLKPHLPEVELILDQDAGAFLPSSKSSGPTESEKELWRAKQSLKNLLFLDGALQGLCDFCESIFGIRVVEDKNSSSVLGWNKNVRIYHLYKTDDDAKLGSIYLDPFYDPYWRSENNNVVMTRLFSQRHGQTDVPVAVIGLSVNPTWDDAPTPVTWKDFQDLLYHFGKALQLILAQKSTSVLAQPADTSEFLATFMSLWIHNDGFLQRIAQLSQDQFTFQPELMKVLREDMKKHKAANLMHTIFLSTLEFNVFTDFDPRGDETLVSLQQRLAEKYIPHEVPDSSDLSPLVQIFRGKAIDPSIGEYSPLFSEILSSMFYEKFQKTDLRDKDAVERLGRGIRDLFLCGHISNRETIEELVGKKVSPDSLKNVHHF